MQFSVDLPKAFSVRDDHEFYPIQHLMARLNPKLHVVQVGTGVHVKGSGTVYWGLVYAAGQRLTRQDVERALEEAGFDMQHNVLVQRSSLWSHEPKEAAA